MGANDKREAVGLPPEDQRPPLVFQLSVYESGLVALEGLVRGQALVDTLRAVADSLENGALVLTDLPEVDGG